MPLSWNEIRSRAVQFSKDWEDATSEIADAKPFWIDFFNVFGISRRRVASFEQPVKKLGNQQGFIDLFWKGTLLVEHKSKGKDLDKAYTQALDYFSGLKERDLPKYVVVSDFAKIRLYDLEEQTQQEFNLKDLHKNIAHFGFIAGYQAHTIKEQDPVNIQAAELMGRLHDQMKESGYIGHDLEVYLVRLLFCLFAEDTGIYDAQQFQEYIENRTNEDGSDLALHLDTLFHVLNTDTKKRLKTRDEQLSAFPYVNGKLFEERLTPAAFDSKMRGALLDCCHLDWSKISPAIFGSLFQSIMDKKARRDLGAHYTSEENILKLLHPLFLNELWEEFEKVKGSKKRLNEFHKKLQSLKFLDPACGCGNFLVIAYRELRLLELEILRVQNTTKQMSLDAHQMVLLDVDQFYGIEIEEFPAQIAQVALWLMDHQMNIRVSEEFGMYFARIPLKTSANIVYDNALRIDWADVVPPKDLNFIMGNPPFVGAKNMDASQRHDVSQVFEGIRNSGLLDLVSAWYVKATHYIKYNSDIACAFVSTNSITTGEQVGVLWKWLLSQKIEIQFAHRTFAWSNEARGKASVHCVIIGFSMRNMPDKRLYEYEDIRGEAHVATVKNINPYLLDAGNIILERRSNPICQVSAIGIGNKPIDDGNYLFTTEEKEQFIKREPQAAIWFKRWLGSREFLNGYERWCLWLGNCPPHVLKAMPESMKRVEAVRKFRLNSKSSPTRKLADKPTHFHVENIPNDTYLIIPKVSSARRLYIPIGFESPDTLASDLVFILENATMYEFGVLSSLTHNAWVRSTCGRLKSDYRYSKDIVYNNYPWPLNPTDKQVQSIENASQSILNIRCKYHDSSLADLYDPLTMPSELLDAHRVLDRAVDTAYGKKNFKSEVERVSFLFDLYEKYN